MFKQLATALLLSTMSLTAVANDQTERMAEVSEKMSAIMYQVMIKEAAANGADVTVLKTKVPDTSWNQEMRDSGACVLDKYEQKIGADGVADMLNRLEQAVADLSEASSMESLSEMGSVQPEGISDQEAIDINSTCGLTEQLQGNMMANEFVQEVMRLMTPQ